MYKYISLIFALFLILSSESKAQTLEELKKMPLDTNSFPLWDNYIKKYAPADSAFQMMHHFGVVHLYGYRPAVAYQVFDSYRSLFPNHTKSIKKMQEICLERTVRNKAVREQFTFYHNMILTNAPSEDAFLIAQRVAGYYIENHYPDSAAFIYSAYKEAFPDMAKRFDKIIDLLQRKEDALEITHFGEPLNTAANEWDPTLTPDGKRLFFSSNRPGTLGGSDIWLCDLYKDSISPAVRLGHGVNSEKSETIDNVLFDGSGLLISGNLHGTFGKHDIYSLIADTTGKFRFKHLPYPINTEYTDESANVSADGQVLLFCSDRPGGIGEYHPMNENYHGNIMGNTDLYVCIKKNGKWGDPINLGSAINTPFAERTPYLHPDGKTLYFSSDGHYGLGGLDVFVSRRLSDSSWTEWSEPVNLGRFVNKSSDDWGYKVSLDGKTAYFTADDLPDGMGGWDIYQLNLPEYAHAFQVVTVSGSVKDFDTDKPVSTVIKYEDLTTGVELGEVLSNSVNGAFMLALPVGKNYGIYIDKEGYLPYSTDIDLKKKGAEDIKQNIYLHKTETAAKNKLEVEISNIYFDYDKAALKDESIPALSRFAEFLKKEERYNITIEGHTDETGSEKYNLDLSEKRAAAVKYYLVQHGIEKGRLSIKAYGKSKPISDQSDKNRRVSFRLIEK